MKQKPRVRFHPRVHSSQTPHELRLRDFRKPIIPNSLAAVPSGCELVARVVERDERNRVDNETVYFRRPIRRWKSVYRPFP